jgi:hypothetical protein
MSVSPTPHSPAPAIHPATGGKLLGYRVLDGTHGLHPGSLASGLRSERIVELLAEGAIQPEYEVVEPAYHGGIPISGYCLTVSSMFLEVDGEHRNLLRGDHIPLGALDAAAIDRLVGLGSITPVAVGS